MAALTSDKLARRRSGDLREFPVKASTTIHAGAQVALDGSGWAVPFSTATGLKSVGVATKRADNSGGADGDVSVRVERGIWLMANSAAGDEITRADIGSDCYGVDDQTVAKTHATNTRSVAGKVFDVDAQGVWVSYA